MRTQARVIAINHTRGMVALETDSGFSTIELSGEDIALDEQVSWNDATPLGSESCRVGQREVEVYFQNHSIPRRQLLPQLLVQPGCVCSVVPDFGELAKVMMMSGAQLV